MESGFIDYITMSEKKNDMSYLIKGNALNCKSETSEKLKLLEKELLVLEEKKKKLW